MNVLFIGSTQFGLNCLKTIREIAGIVVCGVISGQAMHRGVRNVLYADFEQYANENGLPFYRMRENMKEQALTDFVHGVGPDFAVCAGWYDIVPPALIERCRIAALHASLLPDYSGGSPLVWAMIQGEKKTGITLFLMNNKVDAGDIIGQREVEIADEDTIGTLYQKVEVLGQQLLREFLPRIADGTAVYKKQDESKRRVFPGRRPEDGEIDWSWDAKRIRNFIRAQTRPYPGAFTIINGKKIILWDADVLDEPSFMQSLKDSKVK